MVAPQRRVLPQSLGALQLALLAEVRSTTYSLNVGLGPARFSAQLALGGNIWDLSLSVGPMGATYGLSGSRVTTNTVTSRGVCK